jgi:hypothetical protein
MTGVESALSVDTVIRIDRLRGAWQTRNAMNRLGSAGLALLLGLVLVAAPVAGHTHVTETSGLYSADCPLCELAHQGPVVPPIELALARLERVVAQSPEKAPGRRTEGVVFLVSPRAPPAA